MKIKVRDEREREVARRLVAYTWRCKWRVVEVVEEAGGSGHG